MSPTPKPKTSYLFTAPPFPKHPFSVIQTLSVAVIILDLEGRITHFNKAAEISSGYRVSEVLGKRPWDFLFSKDDALVLEQAFETLKSSGLQTEMDTAWKSRDGTERILHWSNAPVLDELGKLKWIVDVFLDITDDRERELRLQDVKQELEVERQISQFLSEASYRIYTSSMDRKKRLELLISLLVPKVSDWSFAVLRERNADGFLKNAYHWDSNKSELISQLLKWKADASISQFISSAHSRAYFNVANPLGATTQEEWAILKNLGWQFWTCIPIVGYHPHTEGALLLASGTTSRTSLRNNSQIAEEFIRRVTPLLDQASLYEDTVRAIQLRDEFISVASHELRTPLTSLRMQIELLQKQPTDEFLASEKGKKLLVSADQQLIRMSKVILEMLDTVNISHGKLRLKFEEFDIRELVRDVVNQLTGVASEKGVEIRVEENLPAIGNWDRFRLEQATSNILMNAIKFGKGLPVSIKIGASGDRVFIDIEDRGLGIKKSDLQRIFERFEQVSSAQPGGLGLGLYIARQIVQAHGGNITVESKVNEGSKFTIEIPKKHK